MFSMLPPNHSHSFDRQKTYQFTPHVSSPLSSSPLNSSPTSSPLSPRNGNLPSRTTDSGFADKMMMSPTHSPVRKGSPIFPQTRTRAQTPNLLSPPASREKAGERTYAKRNTKPNPLLNRRMNGEEGRETRRKLFLKNVRKKSEDKRWRDRGGDEEMLRTLFAGEERERRIREEIAMASDVIGEEELSDEILAQQFVMEELETYEKATEEFYQKQDVEFEVLLDASLPEYEQTNTALPTLSWGAQSRSKRQEDQYETYTPYGSDDDEYDEIFMDVIKEESRPPTQQYQHQHHQHHQPHYLQQKDDEMMDMD